MIFFIDKSILLSVSDLPASKLRVYTPSGICIPGDHSKVFHPYSGFFNKNLIDNMSLNRININDDR